MKLVFGIKKHYQYLIGIGNVIFKLKKNVTDTFEVSVT